MLKRTVTGVVAAVFALGLTTAASAQAPAPKPADTMEKKADTMEKKSEKKPAKKSKKEAKSDKKMGDKTAADKKVEKPAEEKK